MRVLHRVSLSLALLCAASAAAAARIDAHREEAMFGSYAFLYAHPDLKHRRAGLDAYEAGRHAEAATRFLAAARFADKPAQAMYAEMRWRGEGVRQDRALAYAWMDLAAERGFGYMLGKRERYWQALSPAERERALGLGTALYRQFGDAVAKPRLERRLRYAIQRRTGSRVGYVGAMKVVLNVGGEKMAVQGATYHASDLWQPKRYWALQDAEWQAIPGGQVDIGPLRSLPPD